MPVWLRRASIRRTVERQPKNVATAMQGVCAKRQSGISNMGNIRIPSSLDVRFCLAFKAYR